jgi:hypothetical protein
VRERERERERSEVLMAVNVGTSVRSEVLVALCVATFHLNRLEDLKRNISTNHMDAKK